MKVLGVGCSLRKGSNSQILVERALHSAAEAGADTELLSMLGKRIGPCDGCYTCAKTGICHLKDNMQDWLPKFAEADAIIFGTPVFFWTLPGQTKVLMDRLYPLYTMGKLANKVGAVVVVASSVGHEGVWQVFNNFFCAAHMLAADLVYGFGRERGEVQRDMHASQAAWELGKQVVALASTRFTYPEAYPHPLYRIVTDRYGVDMSPARGRFDELAPPRGGEQAAGMVSDER